MSQGAGAPARRAGRCAVVAAAALALWWSAAAAAGGVVATLRDWGRFDDFVALIERAGLEADIDGGGPWTVFAPETVPPALRPPDAAGAASVVWRHVVPGTVSLRALARERARTTSAGHRLRLVEMSGAVLVDNRWILQGDIAADNGLIHIIDEAIAPRP